MSVHSVTCPSCAAVLKSSAPLSVGRAIKCPKCAKTFPIPAPPAPPAPPTEAAPPAIVQKLTCPGCKMILKPSKPVPVGKSVKCPKCSHIVTVESEVPKAEAAPKPATPPAAAPKPAPAAPEPAMVSQLQCPACSTRLKPAKPVPAGKSIKCPKCAVSFPAKPAETKPAETKPAETKPSEDESASPFAFVDDKPAAPAATEAEEKPELIEDEKPSPKPKKRAETEESDEANESAETEEETDEETGKRRVNKPALMLLAGALVLLFTSIGLLVMALSGVFDPEKPAPVASGKAPTGPWPTAPTGAAPASAATPPPIAPTQPAAVLPVWTADAAEVEKLGDEVTLSSYALRAPKNHVFIQEDNADGSITFSFQGREATFQPYPALTVNIGAEPGVMRGATLEKAISEVLKQVTAELRDITATWSAAESGQVGGIPFVRVRLTGTFRQTNKVQGFFYLGRDGATSISFFGVNAGTEPELMLKQVEAAALTIRKGAGPPRQVDVAERQAIQAIRAAKGTANLIRVNGVLQLIMRGPTNNDLHLPPLAGLTSLARLDLTGARISDLGLEQVKKLSNLRELFLDGTLITDAGLAQLAGLNELTVLHISGTKITDASLTNLAKLTKLKQVRLDGTQVTDAGVTKLKEAIPGLEVLK